MVTVLVIIYRGSEHIGVHESEARAWSQLMDFIESHWHSHFGQNMVDMPEAEDERALRFFSAKDDSYIMGNADLSELEAHVESALRGSIG